MHATRQYCLTLDLKDDEDLIREYEEYHQPGSVWSEVVDSIRESGIIDMQIYRSGTQLIMVMSVDESFSFEDKARQDSQNSKVIEWERLMTQFQLVDDDADSNEKWRVVANVFKLQEHI